MIVKIRVEETTTQGDHAVILYISSTERNFSRLSQLCHGELGMGPALLPVSTAFDSCQLGFRGPQGMTQHFEPPAVSRTAHPTVFQTGLGMAADFGAIHLSTLFWLMY